MSKELTITITGPACTGKGVIGLIIEKALQDLGVNARYRNDDFQSKESLKAAYDRREEILKQIDPQITIVEEHVGKTFKILT